MLVSNQRVRVASIQVPVPRRCFGALGDRLLAQPQAFIALEVHVRFESVGITTLDISFDPLSQCSFHQWVVIGEKSSRQAVGLHASAGDQVLQVLKHLLEIEFAINGECFGLDAAHSDDEHTPPGLCDRPIIRVHQHEEAFGPA